jgi:hypothetical protein
LVGMDNINSWINANSWVDAASWPWLLKPTLVMMLTLGIDLLFDAKTNYWLSFIPQVSLVIATT